MLLKVLVSICTSSTKEFTSLVNSLVVPPFQCCRDRPKDHSCVHASGYCLLLVCSACLFVEVIFIQLLRLLEFF